MNGLKLEIGNWREMKRVYELDVYKLAEELSDKNKGTFEVYPLSDLIYNAVSE